ncbi:Adaptive-response sensory-kinase SasA [Candidatus Lokiarchaeum ossiferum]|uniref:Adaptive-response sensory-kinase SasA n=1 Tax=Candidatus Lokiarchaeum ossiferum TaxID=2951803 RepID=A0ABY6HZD0_9ARCH|nr:Adaptive-response sensory-kinase SasA [Candidatus Lokiarchaeum sp. B-35]
MVQQSGKIQSNNDKKLTPSQVHNQWPEFLEKTAVILYRSNLNHLWGLEILKGGYEPLFEKIKNDFISNSLDFSKLISQSDEKYIRNIISHSIAENQSYCLVYQIKLEDGSKFWVRDVGNPVFNEDGSFEYLTGCISNHTTQKTREIAQTQENQKKNFILENIPIAVIEYDLNLKITEWNNFAEKIFGYPKMKAIGRNIESLLVPADLQDEIESILQDLQIKKTPSTNINENLTKSGDRIICEWYNTPILDESDNLLGYASMVQDITDRRIIEYSLKESEALFRTMSEQSILGMFLIKNQSFVFVNEGFAQILGYTVNDVTNWDVEQKLREIVHPDDLNNFLALHDQKMLGKSDFGAKEYRIIRSDGKIRWVRHYSKPIESISGRLIQGVILDITEQKNAILNLEESESKFRAISDQTFVGINVTQDGVTKYSNLGTETITGYSQEERDSWGKDENLQLIHKDDWDYVTKLFDDDQNHEKNHLLEYTYRIKTKDGTIKWIEDYSKKISYEGRPAWLSIILDVTEKRKMEEEIIKTSKLDSLGVLAGGIAHDFNNLLTSIIGNLSIASLEIENHQSSLRELINEAESACIRAAQLTKQLLTFSKGGAPIKKSESISHIISDTVQFLLRGSNIQFDSQIDENLDVVNVDVSQISQVIQNIVINAKQAMPHGGTIKISASNFIASSGDHNFAKRKGLKYVQIVISDSGIGIPREFLPRIFDPYFTTKESGSGLGLAMCYSIIKKHDGIILVDSEVGKGTTFTIYLPSEVKKK